MSEAFVPRDISSPSRPEPRSIAAVCSPEAELLLCVAGVPRESQEGQIRRVLARGLDIEKLLSLAERNRMFPALASHLVNREETPAALRARLRTEHDATALHNLRLTRELAEVSQLFAAEGVSAISYKGPTLAAMLYGNLSLRQFWDLDVLVHKSDVLRAKNLLVARGYETEHSLSPEEEQRHLDRDCEYNFDHPQKSVHLEIHWDILDAANRGGLRTDVLWERTATVTLGGTSVTTFAPEELFLVLCVHGGEKHRWNRLKWIADLALFLEKYPDADWKRILELADEFGAKRVVLEGAHLAASLLGASLPERISMAAGSEPLVPAVTALTPGHLFRDDAGLPGFREWRRFMEVFGSPPTVGRNGRAPTASRWLYLRAVMEPHWVERTAWPLPPTLSFLHYIYRPLRLARRHGTRLFGRLR